MGIKYLIASFIMVLAVPLGADETVLGETKWIEHKILASDGAAGDYFGINVSISDNHAIVGATSDDEPDTDTGAVFIFENHGAGWIQTAKLIASDASAIDYFGYGVSICGNHAMVGEAWDDDNGTDSGSVYIFEKYGAAWIQVAKLTAADGTAGDRFGITTSICGDVAVVGADHNNGVGAAYVFEKIGATWTQVAKLTPADGVAEGYFGAPVSLSGDHLIIGASGDDDLGFRSGSAYIFERENGGWVQTAKLTAVDGTAGDRFGFAASISGNHAVVGALSDGDTYDSSGSAYIFEKNGATWAQVAKLTEGDGAAEHRFFGYGASISGDRAVVSAPNAGYISGGLPGAAYIFEKIGTTWTRVAKITASDGMFEDRFGREISFSGEHLIIGSFRDDDNGEDSGSAYVYDMNQIFDSDNDGVPDGWDACPDTPDDTITDASGCALTPGDCDGDGDVDALDLKILANHYGTTGPVE
jgi:hypothetical protein